MVDDVENNGVLVDLQKRRRGGEVCRGEGGGSEESSKGKRGECPTPMKP